MYKLDDLALKHRWHYKFVRALNYYIFLFVVVCVLTVVVVVVDVVVVQKDNTYNC